MQIIFINFLSTQKKTFISILFEISECLSDLANQAKNVCNMNTSTNCAAYQLFDVIADPSERHDLYGEATHDATVAELKEMYAKERAVARYPCMRGPAGRANAEGVLQPWLQPQDKCEP